MKKHRVWPQAFLVGWLIMFVGTPAVMWVRSNGESVSWSRLFIVSILMAAVGATLTQLFLSAIDQPIIFTTPAIRCISGLVVAIPMGIAVYWIGRYLSLAEPPSYMVVLGAGIGMIAGYSILSRVVAKIRLDRKG